MPKRSKKTGVPDMWFAEIAAGVHSRQWDVLRDHLREANLSSSKSRGFWKKSFKGNSGLLEQDPEGRTPLHLALLSRRTPGDIILSLLALEPKAAGTTTERGRCPLHFAVLHGHSVEIIAALVQAYPKALSHEDVKNLTPLAYAVEVAIRRTSETEDAPRTFWMNLKTDAVQKWQERQKSHWTVVSWLLMSMATNAQSSLTVSGKNPMLVQAMMYSAPPSVISLLIGASSSLLEHEKKATAFAGSTLYTCLHRHYPFEVLSSLTTQCPSDVHTIRDETGMGLLSAHFISAFFEQMVGMEEWTVRESFYVELVEVISKATLEGASSAFIEWWKKTEFLLKYCSGRDTVARGLLLHAAVSNSDTPPPNIDILLSLHPRALRKKDPETGMLPLHLAVTQDDYIPRAFENQIVTEGTVSLLVQADPQSIHELYKKRLPLHLALEAGKLMNIVSDLVDPADDFLKQRDPKTGLFPFMLAATYVNRSGSDSVRWTCTARNKYSYAVWKGLTDRQRAAAVVRVVENEETERLSTIFELLRRQPRVIRIDIEDQDQAKGMAREPIRRHYFSWCFSREESGKLIPNHENMEELRGAIIRVAEGGWLSSASASFNRWWLKMKTLVRKSFPSDLGIIPGLDAYLLHSAVANKGTPPQVVQLLLAIYPSAPSLKLPHSPRLPIHYAASASNYTPREFEGQTQISCLQMILDAFPDGAKISVDGRLPLHSALQAGKTWEDVRYLIDVYPKSLSVRDRRTGLYPFLMAATRKAYKKEDRLRFQQLSRNSFKDEKWEEMTDLEKARDVVRVRRDNQLQVLSTIYRLLRRDASVVPSTADMEETVRDDASLEAIEESEAAGIVEQVREASPKKERKSSVKSSALMRLLGENSKSRNNLHTEKENGEAHEDAEDDMFECDDTIFSGVDILSTISETESRQSLVRDSMRDSVHLAHKKSPKKSPLSRHTRSSSSRRSMMALKNSSGHYAAPYHAPRTDDSSSSSSSFSSSSESSSYGEFAEDSLRSASSRDFSFFHEESSTTSEDTRTTTQTFSNISVVSGMSSYSRIMDSDSSGIVGDADSTATESSSVVNFQVRRRSDDGQEQGGGDVRLARKFNMSMDFDNSTDMMNFADSPRAKRKVDVQKEAALLDEAKLEHYSSSLDGEDPQERSIASSDDEIFPKQESSVMGEPDKGIFSSLKASPTVTKVGEPSADCEKQSSKLEGDPTQLAYTFDRQAFRWVEKGDPRGERPAEDVEPVSRHASEHSQRSTNAKNARESYGEQHTEDPYDGSEILFSKLMFRWKRPDEPPLPRPRSLLRSGTAFNPLASKPMCTTCGKNVPAVLLVPCRHLSACRTCNETSETVVCPLCSEPVLDRIMLY